MKNTAPEAIASSSGNKLKERRCSTKKRQYFFSNRVMNMWGSLPDQVVSAATVNCFNGQPDRQQLLLIGCGYFYQKENDEPWGHTALTP